MKRKRRSKSLSSMLCKVLQQSYCVSLRCCAKKQGLVMLYFRLRVMEFKTPVFHHMDNPAAHSKKIATRLMTYLSLPWMNMCILVAPIYLCYDWAYQTIPLVSSVNDWRNIISFIFYTMLFAFFYLQILLLREKSPDLRASFTGTCMLIIPFLPSSNLFFPVGFVIAERVLYLPTVGFAILLALIFHKINEDWVEKQWSYSKLLVIYLGFYAVRLLIRNNDWRSKYSFHRSGALMNPRNSKCLYNFANTLMKMGKHDEAIAYYEKSIGIYKKPGAMHNLAYLLHVTGRGSHVRF